MASPDQQRAATGYFKETFDVSEQRVSRALGRGAVAPPPPSSSGG